jgi:hypothetical protein
MTVHRLASVDNYICNWYLQSASRPPHLSYSDPVTFTFGTVAANLERSSRN